MSSGRSVLHLVLLLVAIVVAGAGGAGTVLWLHERKAAALAAVSAVPEPTPAAVGPAPAATPPPPAAPEPVVAASAPANEMQAPAAANERAKEAPDPSTPVPQALEDVVGRALPAVVLVETPQGRGSAFFVAKDRLVTNAHVVGSNGSATVRAQNGVTHTATVAARTTDYDLAILQIYDAKSDQAFLPLGAALAARAGQEVIAIGSPLGIRNSVTRGIVSGVRQMGAAVVVQTDTALAHGNSGGPLLDRNGVVIGINSSGFEGSQGLNFAVAAEHAAALLAGKNPALPEVVSDKKDDLARYMPTVHATSSEADRARERAARVFENELSQINRDGQVIEIALGRYLNTFFQGRINGTFEHNYYALFEPNALVGSFVPSGEYRIEEFRRSVNDLRTRLMNAEETARRADVAPGTRRELRAKYKLDNRFWDSLTH